MNGDSLTTLFDALPRNVIELAKGAEGGIKGDRSDYSAA